MTFLQKYWQSLIRKPAAVIEPIEVPAASSEKARMLDFDIAPDDPLLEHLLKAQGSIEISELNLESTALQALKNSGVRIAVPLISQGELIGLLNLGPRRSEQEYSGEDRRLLQTLATQAAPALRVAQLLREQQAEARERERMDQELKVARLIQQTLLPQQIPSLPGWQIAAHWQPARAVSGDFYDFILFPDGRMGLVIADVTDKGVPAAMVMATSRTILRDTAERLVSPGAVLAKANNRLCPEMPLNMYVTCLYAVLDPATGCLVYANAGHPLSFQAGGDGLQDLRARGMPLGLMPDMLYEEKETTLAPGEQAIFYSDGLVEAHNTAEEMFGFNRLRQFLSTAQQGENLIQELVSELGEFVGDGKEQEDDVTIMTIYHLPRPEHSGKDKRRVLADFEMHSQPGNEIIAVDRLVESLRPINMPEHLLSRLKTAAAEITMNAMEHGNRYRPDLPVHIRVLVGETEVAVQIIDHGGGKTTSEAEQPDLDAKLAGLQSPRGWGLYLVRNMVDDMSEFSEGELHTVELMMKLKKEEAQ